jgi:DNA polymerase zeta
LTAIFYCYQNEDETLPDTTIHRGYYAGYVVVVDPTSGTNTATRDGRVRLDDVPCHVVESELDLINWVVDMVKAWDPDVLAGWELHNASWGYLCSRASEAFGEWSKLHILIVAGIDVMEQLSRVVSGHSSSKKDFYSATHTSTFKVSGRHVLNIWRICRSEYNLTQYTFENVVFHALHQRSVPPQRLLTLVEYRTTLRLA